MCLKRRSLPNGSHFFLQRKNFMKSCRKCCCVESQPIYVLPSESATTAPVTTAPLTARWTRWTTGTSRTIPSPGWDITWRPAAGGARTTRGPGGSNPGRWWWRLSRGQRNAWSQIRNWCLLTCTRRWRPFWASRENPCGSTCSSTKSTTRLTCMINNCTDRMETSCGKWLRVETVAHFYCINKRIVLIWRVTTEGKEIDCAHKILYFMPLGLVP